MEKETVNALEQGEIKNHRPVSCFLGTELVKEKGRQIVTHSSQWIVHQSGPHSPPAEPAPLARSIEPGTVMAWARDSVTGEPVYILELDKARAGARCGCECPSCALPLTAVNAAKKEYLRRPHFRHPDGAGKSDCMYLAARLAALQLLREQGVFLLPSRKVSGRVIGLSGLAHEAWVEQKPELVRIRDFSFSDKAAALLTLDDGRQLRIELTGRGGHGDSAAIPTIMLKMETLDPAIASMSLQELKSRLTLTADGFCWASHWNDLALQVEAEEKARQLADQCLDLAPSEIGRASCRERV